MILKWTIFPQRFFFLKYYFFDHFQTWNGPAVDVYQFKLYNT
jgi:hypothetical protein